MPTTQHPAADAIAAGLRRANALANCNALAVITRQFWSGYSLHDASLVAEKTIVAQGGAA